eukprot:gnl/TRDRNA2_/TRDRNA2_157892_c0_seq1.p1 gnl/TRDRNA2_/TRDRNA2_157892_c0~~gnl/TRDRNA2_/TRDRNA2_157892_c0_seq1.p1  ORF type:complete len:814 (-),score=150.38 gnl/TRDRNA2_/TRDRNA2_157892_c0_seq1:306-2747(-)
MDLLSLLTCKRRGDSQPARSRTWSEDQPVKETKAQQVFRAFLNAGGDERIVINPKTGLNKYKVPLEVMPGAIHRSSATANAITPELKKMGEDIVADLLQKFESTSEKEVFRSHLLRIREELRKVWNIDIDTSISFVSSGTDAEILPLTLAVLRAARVREEDEDEAEVLSVLTAAGETGGNTKMAALGKVCGSIPPMKSVKSVRNLRGDDLDPQDEPLSKQVLGAKLGDNIFPGCRVVTAREVPIRDDITGELITPGEMDAKIENIVKQASASGRYSAIVVHMVIGSKTGHCVPSVTCFQRLASTYPQVIPVVDACQMRGLKALSIRRFIKLGFIVICTGSKFYGGPPFSGVVLFPQKFSQEMEQLLSASAACRSCIDNSLLSGYFCGATISDDLANLRMLLRSRPNFGLLLRWEMALQNIQKYQDIAESTREEIIQQWVTGVRKLIRESPTHVELLDKPSDESIADDEDLKNVVFGIGLPRTGTHSLAEALKILGFRGLNRCVLTKSTVQHVPRSQNVVGKFSLDNSHFRDYQQLFEDNPGAKFILTTRDAEPYKQSIERWDEKNQDRDVVADIPKDSDAFINEVTTFFVHKRAAHQLLIIDVFKMQDAELWSKLMNFVYNEGDEKPFDCVEEDYQFPRAVVQVSGALVQNAEVEKQTADVHTSANDAELLPGQVNTVIPIVLKKKKAPGMTPKAKAKGDIYERLILDELVRVHELMARDCTQFSPPIKNVTEEEKEVLSTRCFIAQPVSLNWSSWSRGAYVGVLRIVLGAVAITEAVNQGWGAADLLQKDRIILKKMEILLDNWPDTVDWEV